ncbi:AMP-binding protein [Trinickia sp. EG282A]|uniref:AMP-binding protein n=1 Tax=Trinickia sp. EG282A TaxID=3237013 RepID=UPI0034D1AB44
MIALHELLLDRCDDSAPVCVDGATTIDRVAFKRRVHAYVQRFGSMAGNRYALCLDDPFEFVCALFAMLATGKEAVIPANAAPGYLEALGKNAYDAIVTDADASAVKPACGPMGVHDDLSSNELRIDPFAPLTLYTSGSSGAPKPVSKTLAQFDAEVRTLEAQWGRTVGQATMLASVPHRHIYGLLFRLFWPLASGRPFDRATCGEPLELVRRLAHCCAGAVVSSPAQLARWPALPGFGELIPAPCLFFSSGAPLDEATALAFARRFGIAPAEIYGSTETGGIAWRQQHVSSAWQPLPGVEVARDDTDTALAVRSPHLSHDGWHRTDDAVTFDENGRFRLRGRLDRIVKLDGKRVALPEIETALAAHSYVAQAAAIVVSGTSRERLGVLVSLTGKGAVALRDVGRVELIRALRTHLAQYVDVVVLPRRWRFCTSLPTDGRGKLPAAAVAAAFGPRPTGVDVLARLDDADAWHYELRVPPTLVHFSGHFPGLPILPGVVMVDWAIDLASDHLDGVREIKSIHRLKFMAPVPPNATLRLTLGHDAARGSVRFSYRLGERECASGVIDYRGRP